MVIWLVMKLLNKSTRRNDRKLLIMWDYEISIIMEYQKIIHLLDNKPNKPSFEQQLG